MLRWWMHNLPLFALDDGGAGGAGAGDPAGGDDPDAPVDVADKPREPTPYEKKLRTEARQHRLARQQAERERDEKIAAANAAAEQRAAEAQRAADQRVIRAELKAHAIKAGIVDLDGLKLLDVSAVKLGSDGEVEGAEALIADLKTKKPWLFGGESSSSGHKPPPEGDPKPKLATQMTADEYKAERARLTARR